MKGTNCSDILRLVRGMAANLWQKLASDTLIAWKGVESQQMKLQAELYQLNTVTVNSLLPASCP